MIFSSKVESNSFVVVSILSLYSALDLSGQNRDRNGRSQMASVNKNRNGRSQMALVTMTSPCAYFDGVAQHGMRTCGVYINPADSQAFEIYWNSRPGSNNRAEAVALAGLLSFLYLF